MHTCMCVHMCTHTRARFCTHLPTLIFWVRSVFSIILLWWCHIYSRLHHEVSCICFLEYFLLFKFFTLLFEIMNWKTVQGTKIFSIALLMYNWHIVYDTYLRCTIWSVLTYIHTFGNHHQNMFITLENFFLFFLASQGMRDLISLTRNWTCALQWKC